MGAVAGALSLLGSVTGVFLTFSICSLPSTKQQASMAEIKKHIKEQAMLYLKHQSHSYLKRNCV